MFFVVLLTLVGPNPYERSDRQVWVDRSPPLAPGDYITAVEYGPGVAEIWVGSWDGYILRSTDDGQSYREVFRPIDAEPLVEPRLANRRAPFIPDLARGLARGLAPGDRTGRALQSADLAGSVRDRPRERASPVLSSLLRPSARTTVEVSRFYRCHEYIYVKTGAGVWGTRDTNFWQQIQVGPAGNRERIYWVSCDDTTPGRFIVNTPRGVLETLNNGASFHYYPNPLPRAVTAVDVAFFDGNGLLTIVSQNRLFWENSDRRSYREVCHLYGDSLEADSLRFFTAIGGREVAAITDDGVLFCDKNTNSIRRIPGEIFSRQTALLAEIVGQRVVVVTNENVYWSEDGGNTFRVAFRATAVDPITRTARNAANRDKYLVHGNRFIWVRQPEAPSEQVDIQALRRQGTRFLMDAYSGRDDAFINRRRVTLDDVLRVTMERFAMSPDELASKRNVLRFRSLMPSVVGRVIYGDGLNFVSILDRGISRRDFSSDNAAEDYDWQLFLAWDLQNLFQDAQQTDVQWRELERLRFRLVGRIRDAYQNLERATLLLEDPRLSADQRSNLRLRRQEAAAYLNGLTGERFPELDPDALPAVRFARLVEPSPPIERTMNPALPTEVETRPSGITQPRPKRVRKKGKPRRRKKRGRQ
ncbi:MAG: hypothetical protein AAF654_04885 [Myxococcota bacterium]